VQGQQYAQKTCPQTCSYKTKKFFGSGNKYLPLKIHTLKQTVTPFGSYTKAIGLRHYETMLMKKLYYLQIIFFTDLKSILGFISEYTRPVTHTVTIFFCQNKITNLS
jgi:hypothetical protein